jgi:ATP-dependent Zn protease
MVIAHAEWRMPLLIYITSPYSYKLQITAVLTNIHLGTWNVFYINRNISCMNVHWKGSWSLSINKNTANSSRNSNSSLNSNNNNNNNNNKNKNNSPLMYVVFNILPNYIHTYLYYRIVLKGFLGNNSLSYLNHNCRTMIQLFTD